MNKACKIHEALEMRKTNIFVIVLKGENEWKCYWWIGGKDMLIKNNFAQSDSYS